MVNFCRLSLAYREELEPLETEELDVEFFLDQRQDEGGEVVAADPEKKRVSDGLDEFAALDVLDHLPRVLHDGRLELLLFSLDRLELDRLHVVLGVQLVHVVEPVDVLFSPWVSGANASPRSPGGRSACSGTS